MDRREFFRQAARYGLGLGAAWLLWRGAPLFAQASSSGAGVNPGGAAPSKTAARAPDLAAVKGAEPDKLFDAGIAAFGGMSAFVRKGQTVVVKPNIGWDQPPESAANTNPILVKRIVEHCFDAGARRVYVFDNSCDSWSLSYKSSMIERYAKEAGATVVPANSQGYFQEQSFPGAVAVKKARVHELIVESDVFINVPVLKHHSGAGMTAAMKNLMGIVWDRQFFHRNDLDQCIADASLYRKPDLNVVDAYKVMKTGGPRGYASSQYDMAKFQILGPDIVACDAAASRTLGFEPSRFRYIGLAAAKGSGHQDLNRLDIRRITL
jgi:uncharacterized protein (DUF362 family)